MGKYDDLPETRRKGLEKMNKVYGFDMSDMEGDFFRYTADHLFADIWSRPGLDDRDRRLLLIGMLCTHGAQDVLSIQIPAAYKDIDVVMQDAADLVAVRHTLRQIVNVKGD